jgi:flagellar motor component MotA
MLIIAGFLFAVLFTAFVGAIDGGLYRYINIPSLVIILAPLVFFLCVSKSGGIIIGYIKASLKRDHEYEQAELESIATAAKNTVRIIHAAGGFGFILGLIAVLANINAPEAFGRSLSVSLIVVLYSIVISFFVFFPLQAWAENRVQSRKHKERQ